ncbi:MAG: hypothetical protein V4702_03905 [Patescibacteria group bacterium]
MRLFFSGWLKEPILLVNLCLATDRIWSHAAEDNFPVDLIVKRNGQSIMVDVSGTTITVLTVLFIMSGETTMQGRVFFISLPFVGFRSVQ